MLHTPVIFTAADDVVDSLAAVDADFVDDDEDADVDDEDAEVDVDDEDIDDLLKGRDFFSLLAGMAFLESGQIPAFRNPLLK